MTGIVIKHIYGHLCESEKRSLTPTCGLHAQDSFYSVCLVLANNIFFEYRNAHLVNAPDEFCLRRQKLICWP